jgi:nucleotide-binding universal stress UspA family protein
MNKHVLMAVDGSENAQNAMLYAAGLLKGFPECQYTLVHVTPIFPLYLMDQTQTHSHFNEIVKLVMNQHQVRSKAILESSRQLLVTMGINPDHIDTISHTRVKGKVKDIIDMAQSLQVVAIVAGYRGWDRKKYTVMGSNCAKLIENSANAAVWVVDGAVRPRRLLVAVDMDDSARRIVDYLAQLADCLQDVHLTFYHVLHNFFLSDMAPGIAGVADIDELVANREKQVVETFWSESLAKLTAAGYKSEQLEMKSPPRKNEIGRMIVAEAENNEYDTLVLGRTGGDEAAYFGHLARYVSERLEQRALWIVG